MGRSKKHNDDQKKDKKGTRRKDEDSGSEDEEYEHVPEHDRVLLRPNMFVGPIKQIQRLAILVHKGKIVYKLIKVPYALERIFLEILSNATDNVNRSIKEGIKPGSIRITMDNHIITTVNSGRPISLKKNKKTGLINPIMIFGVIGTGSNFGDDKTGVGQNGLGGKLANIFAEWFRLNVKNAIQEKEFTKTWRNNMYKSDKHEMIEYNGHDSFTEISYKADLARFGYEQYNREIYDLFCHAALSSSWICRIPIHFNDEVYNLSNIVEYANYIFDEDTVKTSITWYKWEDPEDVKRKGKIETLHSKLGEVTPDVELMLLYTPDESKVISFVNSLYTAEGGSHVDAAFKKILGGIVKSINKELKEKGLNNKINIKDIIKHVSMIISCYNVKDPQFSSQCKNLFVDPEFNLDIPDDILKGVKKWGLIQRIKDSIMVKQLDKLNKEGKNRRVNIDKESFHDATYAGTKRRDETTLVVVEGDSAGLLPNHVGRPKHLGIIPIKGKSLNVRNATMDKIANNEEIKNIVKILGLDTTIDYTKDNNREKIRYGKLVFAMDADRDGSHIAGLLLNFLDVLYPSLLKLDSFLFRWQTPIISITKGNKVIRFYELYEYTQYLEEHPECAKWHYEYYKGLASLLPKDREFIFKNPRFVELVWDKRTPKYLDLAFNSKNTDERKEWIENRNEKKGNKVLSRLEYREIDKDDKMIFDEGIIKFLSISNFVRYDLVSHAEYNNIRSIANFIDMKPCQRMIIYVAMLTWRKINTRAKDMTYEDYVRDEDAGEIEDKDEERDNTRGKKERGDFRKEKDLISIIKDDSNGKNTVSSFAGNVKINTEYQHGEKSLEGAVVKMSLYYPGENNIPLLQDLGDMGNRTITKPGSSRYIYTKLSNIAKFIFREDDDGILNYIPAPKSDFARGHIEPENYYPIAPIYMFNGVIGIGTGSSTCILNHHPINVVDSLIECIDGKEHTPLIPWYKGFKGTIQICDKNKEEISMKKLKKLLQVSNRDIVNLKKDKHEGKTSKKGKNVDENLKEDLEEEEDTKEKKKEAARVEKRKKDNEEAVSNEERKYYVIKGVYQRNEDEIIVTELPIGINVKSYSNKLDNMIKEKHIKSYLNESVANDICFYIYGFSKKRKNKKGEVKKVKINHYTLGLVRIFTTGNIVLIRENKPVRYNNTKDLIYDFYDMRVGIYDLRKEYHVNLINKELVKLNEFMAFVKAVAIDEVIEVRNKKVEDVKKQMIKIGINPEVYSSKVLLSHISKNKIKSLKQQIGKLTMKRDYYINTPSKDIYRSELLELRQAIKTFYKLYKEEKC